MARSKQSRSQIPSLGTKSCCMFFRALFALFDEGFSWDFRSLYVLNMAVAGCKKDILAMDNKDLFTWLKNKFDRNTALECEGMLKCYDK